MPENLDQILSQYVAEGSTDNIDQIREALADDPDGDVATTLKEMAQRILEVMHSIKNKSKTTKRQEKKTKPQKVVLSEDAHRRLQLLGVQKDSSLIALVELILDYTLPHLIIVDKSDRSIEKNTEKTSNDS